MKAQNPSRKVKVSFKGETKRLTVTGDYEALVKKTREAFGAGLYDPIKYFYLDDENEIISINSQSDFNEALLIEDLAALKLTVAAHVAEARQQLTEIINDNMSLAESLSQSQFLAHPVHGSGLGLARADSVKFDLENEFEDISHMKASTFREMPSNKLVHEIACGSDNLLTASRTFGTGTESVNRGDMASNTMATATSDRQVGTQIATSVAGTQMQVEQIDSACGGNAVVMADQASQMHIEPVNCSEAEVSCNLLLPDSGEDDEPIETVQCFKCDGKQVNKKGMPCRKCNGTGQIASKAISEVVQVVREEVKEFCTSGFTQMMKEYLSDKREKQNEEIHDGVECDVCGVNPINGIRYKCSVRDDYDICQNCEVADAHPHPMLKIRRNGQAPAQILCQYRQSEAAQMEAAKAESRASQQKAELKKFEAEAKKKAKRIHYSGRFVKESITDKHQVTSGEKFTKEWTFRNDGETAWPMDTIFIQTNGDEMQACPAELTQEVPANSEHSWRLQLVAPEKAGRYTSYFRMATGDNKRFGHKVWCDIQVLEKPEPVKKVPVVPSLGLSDLPKVDEEMKVVEPAIKMVPQDEQIEEAKDKVEDSPLTFSSLMKTPKQAYFEQVLAEEDEALRAALIQLYEIGCIDFAVNKVMFSKYQDVNKVAEQLICGNGLSESTFSAIFDKKN